MAHIKKQQYKTYQDIYNTWVEQYENSVEESTFVKTIGIFKNHILPAMGSYKVDKIDIATCQKHVNQWAKKLKRFRMVKSYAAKVLDYAIKHGYIDKLQPITTHGLRHTHCSLLFEAGASIKEVQERPGHTEVKTTMDIYTHVTKKTKASTIDKFEAYINAR
ncbi:site-specific integrase [Lysinibacillus sp. NPDC048646]|uniref:N-terminal phage integrase SAM-like domain-containing protein n=1 Tax=Lysinibacillus sp. NPDC048646 TaxID=3390574 RepID=UPI003CFE79AB